MEDVIRVKDQFYVLATSSLADDRTRVLKYGETFAVFNRFGDIESAGLGEQGIYHAGTRYLSRYVLRLGDNSPQVLRSTIQDDNAFLTVDMMNVDIHREGELIVPRGSLHLFRAKFLWDDICYEKLRVSNFSLSSLEASISIEFDADFVDIFQVRGAKREGAGSFLPAQLDKDAVVLGYKGLDGIFRRTRLQFDPAPDHITDRRVEFSFALKPKQEIAYSISTSCEEEGKRQELLRPRIARFDQALHQTRRTLEQQRRRHCQIHSSNRRFNLWLSRSEADLHMMLLGNPEGAYPYAGVPWFNTVFGRDGIITAMECLWLAPWVARSVLSFLAEMQATEVNRQEESEPGKILHEMRRGEMANLKEVPFGRYYGSVDTTPLFVMLAGAYLDRSGDQEFLKTIWPNVLAALDWIDRYGDEDHDDFVEYQQKSNQGLVQQGWKDSHDSISHQDGRLADAPIALCEVQGYVFAARLAASRIVARMGNAELAQKLAKQAEATREKFERDFWDAELKTYVLALDGQKRPCRVLASNAGHALFAGIASRERAKQLAPTLLNEELFSGWGVRTLGSAAVRYNPMSYHNGSVWPHDNAMIASGLARYGFRKEAAAILNGMFEASVFMELNRLPELFCGFHKRSGNEGPTLYPVACSPQSWASAAVYCFLEACLGLEITASDKRVRFHSPQLPEFLAELRVENLQVGDGAVDFVVRNVEDEVRVEVSRTIGGVRVESLGDQEAGE